MQDKSRYQPYTYRKKHQNTQKSGYYPEYTKLYEAIASDSPEETRVALHQIKQKDLNPLWIFKGEGNAFRIAFEKRSFKVIPTLLKAGLDPTNTLFHAVFCNKLELLKLLLEYLERDNKPFIYRITGEADRTLLHVAIIAQSKEVFDFLLTKYGHDELFLNAQDFYEETALHKAVTYKNPEMIQQLLNTKIDRTILNKNKMTALASAGKIAQYFILYCLLAQEEPAKVAVNNNNQNATPIPITTNVNQEKMTLEAEKPSLVEENLSLRQTVDSLSTQVAELSKELAILKQKEQKIPEVPLEDSLYFLRSITRCLNETPKTSIEISQSPVDMFEAQEDFIPFVYKPMSK